MRLSLLGLASLLPLSWAADAAYWASEASSDGIIRLDNTRFDELLAGDDGERDYGVTVILTALPAAYKCTPCHEFQPVFESVAASWRRVPREHRDKHFFAQLDFHDGQEIFKRLGLASAPTLYYHPPTTGPRASTQGVQHYDLNRA
jgi:oligosaccharyltransferase complex subunit gamma